jgi:pilus assembly protein CpaE
MAPTRSRTILIVDDDIWLRMLLRQVLEDEGYQVVEAGTAEEGYELAVASPPDFVVTDLGLPGMNGRAFCQRLRQTPSTRALPVLILTSSSDIDDKIEGFEAGADDYLTKPFEPKELVYRVRNLLERLAVNTPATSPKGRIIVVFSPKGGVGKTTVSVNLALALQLRSGKPVALFDGDFSFGDVSVHLDVQARHSVLDLIQFEEPLDSEVLDQVMARHPSGVSLLLAPFHPESSELVTASAVASVLPLLAERYSYTVVDSQPTYDERLLTCLEHADEILLVLTPEIGPIKHSALFLDLADKIRLPSDKIHLVLNRANSNVGIEVSEIQRALRHPITFHLSSGGRQLVMSVNRGVPLVLEHPQHPVSQEFFGIADTMIQRGSVPALSAPPPEPPPQGKRQTGFLRSPFQPLIRKRSGSHG